MTALVLFAAIAYLAFCLAVARFVGLGARMERGAQLRTRERERAATPLFCAIAGLFLFGGCDGFAPSRRVDQSPQMLRLRSDVSDHGVSAPLPAPSPAAVDVPALHHVAAATETRLVPSGAETLQLPLPRSVSRRAAATADVTIPPCPVEAEECVAQHHTPLGDVRMTHLNDGCIEGVIRDPVCGEQIEYGWWRNDVTGEVFGLDCPTAKCQPVGVWRMAGDVGYPRAWVRKVAQIKEADARMLATEARDLMSPLHPEWRGMLEPYDRRVYGWSPDLAKALFLEQFARLGGKADA